MPFYAAQPIITPNEEVIGYEVLHRTSDENRFPLGVNPDSATSSVLYCLFGGGTDEQPLSSEKPVFVNFSDGAIRDKIWEKLNPQRIVIELLESCNVDSEFEHIVREAKDKGFIIAIDDYNYESKWDGIIDVVDIVKFDMGQTSTPEIESVIRDMKKAPGQLWLAEKVECPSMFSTLRDYGFDLFQGFLWGKPQMHKVSFPSPLLF